jgi:hypothetical protein
MHIVALGQGFLAFGETAEKIAALLRGQFRFATEADAALLRDSVDVRRE